MLFGTNVGMFSTHYLVQLLHFLNAHAGILGSIYSIVLTGFAKAFDWITQFLLINCMLLGARLSLIQWVCSFLMHSVQQAQYKRQLSIPSTVTGGVPQGNVWGCSFILAIINDTLQSSDIRRWKYLDDLTLVLSSVMSNKFSMYPPVSPNAIWTVVSRFQDAT